VIAASAAVGGTHSSAGAPSGSVSTREALGPARRVGDPAR
jgi:hypothetical protein